MKVLVIFLSFVMLSAAAQAQNTVKITDSVGRTQGYVDTTTGRITDSVGRTQGYVDATTGRITDSVGRTQGYAAVPKTTGSAIAGSGYSVRSSRN